MITHNQGLGLDDLLKTSFTTIPKRGCIIVIQPLFIMKKDFLFLFLLLCFVLLEQFVLHIGWNQLISIEFHTERGTATSE